jgi:hypothetical protein
MNRNLLTAMGLGIVAVMLLAAPAHAQRGRFGFGRQQTAFSLLRYEAVQKDIGLTDASKAEAVAEEYNDAVRSEMESAGIDFGGLRDLPEAERNAKLREITAKSAEVAKKVGDKLEPKLKEALTAEQLKRLGEIKVQAGGVASLSDAVVAKELGLSDEQKKKLADIQTEGDRAVRELFAAARDGGFQEAMTKVREANEKTLAKATEVLDAGQKEKFAALKGKPFDLSQLAGRRRGNN